MIKEFTKRNYFDLMEFSLTLLFAFFLLVEQKIIVYIIAFMGVHLIIEGFVRGIKKPNKVFYPFIILFLIYILGLLFTDNFDYGGKDIETRLSFLLLPFFYGARKRETPLSISWISWVFIAGAAIYLTNAIVLAYDCLATENVRFCFESSNLSGWIHPTYAAIYLIAGSAFVLFDAFGNNGNRLKQIAAILVSVVFYYFVYKFYSLGPWIGFAGMLSTVLFAFFYYRKQIKFFLIGIVLMGIVGFVLLKNLDLLRSDYDAVTNELTAYFDNKEAYIKANQNNAESVKARLIIWNTCFNFIGEHPFGVGTGDLKDQLLDYYRQNGMDTYADKKLNPHCQYLQTAASVGIFSALFLIATLFYYVWIGFKNKNLPLIALVSLFATSSLFESILERQWGILFFLFFLSVFLTTIPEKVNEN